MNTPQVPPYAAPPWLRTGHQQTLYMATLWKPPLVPEAEAHTVSIDEQIRLRCFLNRSTAQNSRCVILVHGLEGCYESPYLLSGAHKALALGLDVMRMNMRSCGPSKHLSRTSYHGGLSDDILAVGQYLHGLGYTEIGLIGYSLGGHQALKLAGQNSVLPDWLKAVAAVSPPLSLQEASDGIMRPINRIYERYFFRRMQKTYRARRRWWPESTDLEALARVKNLREFDDYITAPTHGFRDAQDYYARCSAENWLQQIRVPTRIVLSADDPIIPLASHLRAMEHKSPAVEWILSSEGGHVGFLNQGELAELDHDERWAENRAFDFIQSHFGARDAQKTASQALSL